MMPSSSAEDMEMAATQGLDAMTQRLGGDTMAHEPVEKFMDMELPATLSKAQQDIQSTQQLA